MTLEQLRKQLLQDNFPSDTYSLDGSTPRYADDAFILTFAYGMWIIEYIERGQRTEKFRSNSEEAACQEFYRIMEKCVRLSK